MALNNDEKLIKNALLFVALLENKDTEDKKANILKLIEDGSDIDARDANNQNNTPLHIATLKEYKDIVVLLLDKGAGIYNNDEGKSPHDIAKELNTNEGRDIETILARSARIMQSNGQLKLELTDKTKEASRLPIQTIMGHNCTYCDAKLTYKKRAGTSGITGQLYETKLLSLILFRALNHKDVEEFYLGTNIDGIGAFDDICLRFKIKGNGKHFAVFLQAKHRNEPWKAKINSGDLYDIKNDFSLIKYFDSYLKIKERFNPDSNDIMFKGYLNEVTSNFIIYTPAMDSFARKKNTEQHFISKTINDLILTSVSGNIFQIQYEDADIDFLANIITKERIKALGKTFINLLLSDTTYQMIMNDDQILRYHMFLAQNVIYVFDCDLERCRKGKFRTELFSSNDELLIALKEVLYTESLQNANISKEVIKESILELLYRPCVVSISKLIVSVIKFNNKTNNFDFVEKNIPEDVKQFKIDLQTIKVTQGTVKDAIELAGKERLQSMSFKLPITFGNLEVKEDESKLNMKSNEFDDNSNEIKNSTDNNTLPAVSFNTDNDRILAKDFLSKLWFYTNQVKENEVENILKKEMIYQHNVGNQKNQSVFCLQSNAVFLRFHDDVQKWWLKSNKAHFLTNACEFYNEAKTLAIDSPLLNILNFTYINKLKNNDIEFRENSIQALNLDQFTSGFLNIITNVNVLSGIKLTQYFKSRNNYCFIDFNYVLSLPSQEFDIVTTELRNTERDTMIISNEGTVLCEKLKLVLHEVYKKKIILITGEVLAAKLKQHLYSYATSYFDVRDVKNSLKDLIHTSQCKILTEATVIFQGDEVSLDAVIDDGSKDLIKDNVLSKLINNERIEIGQTLTNPNYEESKYYYVDRNLKKRELLYKVNTLQDLKDDVIVITAIPGMGKSTLLTHLSIETKKICSRKSIARVNLLDCSKKFHEWQEKRTSGIDIKDTMTLIYEAVINEARKGEDEVKFVLEEINGTLVLKDCNGISGSALLELELFIYCYNNGEIIFLFDGFDETCPYYETEALEMIRSLTMRSQKNSDFLTATTSLTSESNVTNKHFIWITSRPYNDIKQRLENEFGMSYSLEPLEYIEQKIFFEKYWKMNIKLQELNYEQFKNIDGFFEYMSRFCRTPRYYDYNLDAPLISLTSVPLHNMYVDAIEYFRSEINHIPLTADKEVFKMKWNTKTRFFNLLEQYLGDYYDLAKILTFSGTPLHMHVAADYFQSEIKNHISLTSKTVDISKKWDIDVNTFIFYERFLETKLKRIKYKEKNGMDIFKPDIKLAYERELKEFILKHKKLAIYAIFKEENISNLLSNEELSEIRVMIKQIQLGEEKTGLIYRVIDDVPRFVHLIFAEYFAVEYICDLLKTTESLDKRVVIWDFILNILISNSSTGVGTVFDYKLKNDTALRNIIANDNNRKIVFDIWMNQSELLVSVIYGDDVFNEKGKTSLKNALDKCLRNSATLLINCLEGNLKNNNIDMFVDMIKSDKFFITAALLNYDELIEIVLNKIRYFGISKMKDAFRWDDLHFCTVKWELVTNEDIITSLHLRVKDIITPRYSFDLLEDDIYSIY